ncbi:transposable element Tcb2 transposase [Trichonephila clavipes]|nr:transposable element Tcb2 transposase [Trichonephila clavipes]
MEWPACSPDMNPIEHVRDALRRRVAGRRPPPQTLQEMERALLEEWDRISQLVINSLIDPHASKEFLFSSRYQSSRVSEQWDFNITHSLCNFLDTGNENIPL